MWNGFHFSVPDDFKVNPGAVEAIVVHPSNPDQVKYDLHCTCIELHLKFFICPVLTGFDLKNF